MSLLTRSQLSKMITANCQITDSVCCQMDSFFFFWCFRETAISAVMLCLQVTHQKWEQDWLLNTLWFLRSGIFTQWGYRQLIQISFYRVHHRWLRHQHRGRDQIWRYGYVLIPGIQMLKWVDVPFTASLLRANKTGLCSVRLGIFSKLLNL